MDSTGFMGLQRDGCDDVAADRRGPSSRAARQCRAFLAHLTAALDATSTTTLDLARHWGVTEKIARDIRSGARPLSGERIDALPTRVRRELFRCALAAVDAEAPPLAFGVERAAMRVAGACSRLLDVAVRAMTAGAVDERALAVAEREVSERARELAAAGRR